MIIDSNVLIDILEFDSRHAGPSFDAVSMQVAKGAALINLIIFAEVASRFASAADTRSGIASLGLTLAPLDEDIAYRAGRAFRDYRRRGGPRTTILPDFVIGAHAEHLGLPILTRDPDRYSAYFPLLRLIDPRTDHG